MAAAPRTVLITGAYGTGKTTLAAEIAELLADHHIPCAAIDLDWLGWFWLPAKREHTVNDIVVANLRAIAGTYDAAGVSHLLLAGTIRTRRELDQLAAVVPGPLRVLQLTVPLAEISRRLSADALSSRAEDLEMSATEPDAGAEIADLAVPNEGDIRALARRVVDWLGWLSGAQRRRSAVTAELHTGREVAAAALALGQADGRTAVRAELLRRDRLATVRAHRRSRRDVAAEDNLFGHLGAHLGDLHGGALGFHLRRELGRIVDTQSGLLIPARVIDPLVIARTLLELWHESRRRPS